MPSTHSFLRNADKPCATASNSELAVTSAVCEVPIGVLNGHAVPGHEAAELGYTAGRFRSHPGNKGLIK